MLVLFVPYYTISNSGHCNNYQDELVRACSLFQRNAFNLFPWGKLLEPCAQDFFSRYPRYVQVLTARRR